MNRRTFLKVSAVSAAGVLLPVFGDSADAATRSPDQWARAGVEPSRWVTPTREFYVQDITSGNPPALDASKWRMIINGLVQKPKIVRLPDLLAKASESTTVHRTLSCIGDPIGGNQIGNAEWTGIPLRVLLKEAGIREQATRAVFRCADLYHTAIPIEDAMHPRAILAFKMNGEDLPREHGYPVRLLNPGKYGQKCPKWINNIEIVAKEYHGYWETRGWSDVAAVKTATRVHVPTKDATLPAGSYRISGSAFDGGSMGGIQRVEVSTDGGSTWHAAEIWASADPLTWSLWQYEWTIPQGAKKTKVLARAIGKDGTVQREKYEDPYPAGAGGYHTVEVKIGS
ncbi:hypothetical protein FJZ36_00065 [Candidatus Poribacteria bacterium]|nr:hypothetical protein [Candidatus Poribacteria bacterium]